MSMICEPLLRYAAIKELHCRDQSALRTVRGLMLIGVQVGKK